MASLKAIRRRIASAKSTQQITRALKLVSAARLRRAQEALINALPYSEALARVADSLLTLGRNFASIRSRARKSDRCWWWSRPIAAWPAATTRTCFAQPRRRCATSAAPDSTSNCSPSAKKPSTSTAAPTFRWRSRASIIFRASPPSRSRATSPPRCSPTTARGAIDEAGIVYTHFQSAVVQKPVYERLLPIKPPGDAGIKQGAEVEAAVSIRGQTQNRLPGRAVARGTGAGRAARLSRGQRLSRAARVRGERAGRAHGRDGRGDQQCQRDDLVISRST